MQAVKEIGNLPNPNTNPANCSCSRLSPGLDYPALLYDNLPSALKRSIIAGSRHNMPEADFEHGREEVEGKGWK